MNDMSAPTLQPVVSAEEWKAARAALLAEEKAVTKALDRLSALRRQMPWQKVDKPYVFNTPDGPKGLPDLFDGRRQLIVYHHMLRPADPSPCPGCSMLADELPNLAHVNARDTTLLMVSRAPLAEILVFRARMGWPVPWVETTDDFNTDFGMGTYGPGYSVFFRDKDAVYYTYSCTDRGTETVVGTFGHLDITPMGRQEKWQGAPDWVPQGDPYVWWRLHDEYGKD